MACPPSAIVFKNLHATWSRGVGRSGGHNQGIGKAVNLVINPLGGLEYDGNMDVHKLKDCPMKWNIWMPAVREVMIHLPRRFHRLLISGLW